MGHTVNRSATYLRTVKRFRSNTASEASKYSPRWVYARNRSANF